jgi:hypothetical protein
MDSEQLGWVIAATVPLALAAFFWMAYNVGAIRTMLENTGLFSGVPCRWCRMPVPPEAAVCGHCGRDLGEPAGSP